MDSKRVQRQNALNNQIKRIDKRVENLKGLSRRFSWYRLFAIIAGGVTIFAASNWLAREAIYISIAMAIAVFSLVVYYHRRIDQWIREFHIWSQIKSTQLARIQLDWDRIPLAPSHSQIAKQNSLEIDLDLHGWHSLHQLIDRTISLEGSELLYKWLTQTNPSPEHINRYF